MVEVEQIKLALRIKGVLKTVFLIENAQSISAKKIKADKRFKTLKDVPAALAKGIK